MSNWICLVRCNRREKSIFHKVIFYWDKIEKVVRAGLDCIEREFAIVYSDNDDNQDYHENFDVSLKLVKDAKVGMRLQLHIENNLIKRIEIDKQATEKAEDRMHKRYERL
jgi:hypothetical protein